VDAINPSIDIRKNIEGPDSQQVVTVTGGTGTATFDIVVTNTGDVPLTDVDVSDPLAPDCDRTFASLAVGASETYTCSVTVTEDFTNTATATGTPPVGDDVTDSDPSSVEVVVVQDLCEDKRPPTTLLMQYDGIDPEVYIVVEHPKDGVIFEGDVDDGGWFEMSRVKQKLNPELQVTIYSDEGGSLTDSFVIHTSCSLPLYIGQTFGTDQSVATITILGEPL